MIEHIAQRLLVNLAVELGKMLRQLDALRAYALTVLAVAAAGDAALLHQRIETLRRIKLTERMEVEEECLRSRRGPTFGHASRQQPQVMQWDSS